MKETLKGSVSEEQFQNWKQQHEDVWQIEFEGSVCYLKFPSRKGMAYAQVVAKTDPIKSNEQLLNDMWLGGDESLRTNNRKFQAVCNSLPAIVGVAAGTIVKL